MSLPTSKELVRRALSLRSVPRPPFLPLVCSIAAQLEQISIKEMFSSPDLLARSVWNAQKLFGYDGVIVLLDPTLEAEACGCAIEWREDGPAVVGHPLADPGTAGSLDMGQLASKGRIPVALEATKRLSLTAGKTVAIAAALTGPLTLVQHLSGRAIATAQEGGLVELRDLLDVAGRIMVQMSRLYCELKVDVVIIHDEPLGRLEPNLVEQLESCFRPVWNVVSFYSAFSIVHTVCSTPKLYRALLKLGADGVMGDSAALADDPASGECCTGLALPLSLLGGDKTEIREQVNALRHSTTAEPLMLTTEREVRGDVPPEKMRYLVEAVRQAG